MVVGLLSRIGKVFALRDLRVGIGLQNVELSITGIGSENNFVNL